jgi:hypothetical protein
MFMGSGKHKWESRFEMTYEQEYLWKYTEWIYLIRMMEEELGKDKAHRIVRKARDNFHTDRYKKPFSERKPIESFQEYIEYTKDTENNPLSKARTLSNIVETSEEYSYHVDECLWAKTFKELGAEDIGELLCEGAFHQVSCVSPYLRFHRTRTLMKGDPYCDYKYTWEEEQDA